MDVKFVATEIDVIETATGKVHNESNVIFNQEMSQKAAKDFMDKIFSHFRHNVIRFTQLDNFSFVVGFINENGVEDVLLKVSQINNKRLIETDIVPKGKYFINYH